MSYEIALIAGHYQRTPGKRIPKELDPNETPEWVLNDRVCDKIEQKLTAYTGYELLRIDDTTGEKNIPLADRVRAADKWSATEWYEVHHNAYQGKPWSGGGIEVYVHPNASAASREMQTQLYDALIAKTGLKGNRANPMAEANYYTLRNTKMPAVLMELGFMDSRVDAPVILTEEYADKCAAAIVEVMVKRGNLNKKPVASTAPTVEKDIITIKLTTLREGAEGAEVVFLQRFLIGYSEKTAEIINAAGGADGKFGSATKKALTIFQSENVDAEGKQLVADGVAGEKTFGAITGQTK